jgi:hypothetical protein
MQHHACNILRFNRIPVQLPRMKYYFQKVNVAGATRGLPYLQKGTVWGVAKSNGFFLPLIHTNTIVPAHPPYD